MWKTNNFSFYCKKIPHKLPFLGSKRGIDYVCKNISKICGIISKLQHSVDIEILKTVHYALGYTYLRYGNIVWGNAVKTVLKPLTTLQNRINLNYDIALFGRVGLDPVYRDMKMLGFPEFYFLEKSQNYAQIQQWKASHPI